MEMMLQTQNLCKYFRKQKAVNNVSLNIEKGQIYGLLGPNGAGKSTTLKMLTGMMKPTAGKIYFDGKLWVPSPCHVRGTDQTWNHMYRRAGCHHNKTRHSVPRHCVNL